MACPSWWEKFGSVLLKTLEKASAGGPKASLIAHSAVIPVRFTDQDICPGPWAQFGVCLNILFHFPF